MIDFPLPQQMLSPLKDALLADLTGTVVQTIGQTIAVAGFPAPVGAMVEVARGTGPSIEAEVVGFHDQTTLIMPLDHLEGVRHGNQVRLVRTARSLRVGPGLLGRVVDAQGRCIDGRPQPMLSQRRLLRCNPETPYSDGHTHHKGGPQTLDRGHSCQCSRHRRRRSIRSRRTT